MAELLGYAPDLRSITGGQGDYTMEFLRYEEVPGHLVVARAGGGGGGAGRVSLRRPARRGARPLRAALGAAVGAARRPGCGRPFGGHGCAKVGRRWLRARCRRAASPSRARSAAARCCAASSRRTFRDGTAQPSRLRAVHRARVRRGLGARGHGRSPTPRRRARRARARWSGACARGWRRATAAPATARAGPAGRPDGLPERHVHAVPADAGGQLGARGRALQRQRARQALAGVIRSLGAPHVQLGPSHEEFVVEILVAWELCWYRFEADLDGEVVRRRAQGYELSELDGELASRTRRPTRRPAGAGALTPCGLPRPACGRLAGLSGGRVAARARGRGAREACARTRGGRAGGDIARAAARRRRVTFRHGLLRRSARARGRALRAAHRALRRRPRGDGDRRPPHGERRRRRRAARRRGASSASCATAAPPRGRASSPALHGEAPRAPPAREGHRPRRRRLAGQSRARPPARP